MKKIYGTPGCAKCHLLKNKLDNNGEKFEYYDVTNMTTDEISEITKKAGTLELPIVLEEWGESKVYKNIILVNLGVNIVGACAITYLVVKTYYMEKFLEMMPSKEDIIKEIINTKIPMVIGPDGQPMVPGVPQKSEQNPLTG